MSLTFKGVFFYCMKSLLIELKILCVKNQFRVLKSFVLSFCLVLVISLAGLSFVSLADVNDLMIGTGSNAFMTMELDDSDYLMMSSRSSIASIQNTVTNGDMHVIAYYYKDGDDEGVQYQAQVTPEYNQGGWSFRLPQLASDCYYSTVIFVLYRDALPSPGTYYFSFDYSSDFSYDYKNLDILTIKRNANALQQTAALYPQYQFSSGDAYCPAFKLNLTNLYQFNIYVRMENEDVRNIAGLYKINFTPTTSDDSAPSTAGTNTSSADYENGVSSSLSDLSSSVDTMTDEISGVTEAIQNLQGAMEPHYSNVLTQLHHITEQLHAFYDQVYNNIHLPELSMLTQIKEAIENIDLQIEVDISEVKTAINNMSQAVQNKLQSTTDQITGGYDNSGIVSDQTEFDSALNEYQQAEDELFEDAKEHINNFEFNTPLDAYVKPLEDILYFLTGIYNGLGGLNIPIQFSLTLTIALILIGYYRIKR